MDDSTLYPKQFLDTNFRDSEVNSEGSFIWCEFDGFKIWKMHDKVLMQLIIATLSHATISYAIGITNSQDLHNRLKEQFSTVTQINIFQMKSKLQTIG